MVVPTGEFVETQNFTTMQTPIPSHTHPQDFISMTIPTLTWKGDPWLLTCYEMVPKKETISCTFINLVGNIQEYNMEKI